MHPRRAVVIRQKFGFANAPRGRDGERPRQRLADLRRADGGERADAAFAVAFKITREAAHAGERAHQRAAADPLGAARRQEGAHVRRPKRCKVFQRGGAAEMRGEEGEQLQHVALIGFERFRRITPLVAEMAKPRRDLGGDFGGDARKPLIASP